MHITAFSGISRLFLPFMSVGTVIAEITFPEREKGVYVIDHTFVDESLRGQGVAKVLMEMAIAQIKEQKGKVEATCSYAQRFLEKHPQ